MRIFRILVLGTLVLTLFSLSSCTSTIKRYESIGKLHVKIKSGIAIAEPVFLQQIMISDLENFEEEAYRHNLFIGEVNFSGGFIQDSEQGNIFRSKEKILQKQAEYQSKAKKWVISAFKEAFAKKYLLEAPFTRELISKDFKIEEKLVFLTKKEIGSDNFNIPLFDYIVTEINPAVFSSEQNNPRPYILVPVIDNWYNHSAGWFNDQEFGCGSGLRCTIQCLVFERESGTLIFREKIELSLIFDYDSMLSVNKIERSFEELRMQLVKKIKKLFE